MFADGTEAVATETLPPGRPGKRYVIVAIGDQRDRLSIID